MIFPDCLQVFSLRFKSISLRLPLHLCVFEGNLKDFCLKIILFAARFAFPKLAPRVSKWRSLRKCQFIPNQNIDRSLVQQIDYAWGGECRSAFQRRPAPIVQQHRIEPRPRPRWLSIRDWLLIKPPFIRAHAYRYEAPRTCNDEGSCPRQAKAVRGSSQRRMALQSLGSPLVASLV